MKRPRRVDELIPKCSCGSDMDVWIDRAIGMSMQQCLNMVCQFNTPHRMVALARGIEPTVLGRFEARAESNRARRTRSVDKFAAWLATTPVPNCECGCGTPLPLKRWHYTNKTLPRFQMGHHLLLRTERTLQFPEFVTLHTGKVCACGCGTAIIPLRHHMRLGIPKFAPGHRTRRPNKRKQAKQRAK